MTDLRQSRPEPPAPYARGTRVDVERSRRELEAFLAARGASDFIVLQDEASARVRFALYGNYFELVLPLPDPQSRAFSHTATGRPRTSAGQQRAYNQTLQEKWRVLLFVTRGKLQAVESGISSLDQEFVTGFLPAAAWPKEARTAESDGLVRAGPWRRVSRTVVGALGAGLLVPASALSAFALPGAAVDRVAGLVWSDKPALFAQSDPSKPALVALPSDPGGSAEAILLSLPAPSGGGADVTGGSTGEAASESDTSSAGSETQTVEAESGDDGSVASGATGEGGSDSMETGGGDPAASSGSPPGGESTDTGGAGSGSDKGKDNGGGNGEGKDNGGGNGGGNGNGNGGGEGNGKGNGNGGGNGKSKGNGGEDKGKGNDTGDAEGSGSAGKGSSGEDKGNGGAGGNGEGKGNGGGGDKWNPGGGESKGNGGTEGKGKGNGGAKGSTGS